MSALPPELQRHNAVIDFAHALVGVSLNRLLHARDSRFVVDALQECSQRLVDAEACGVEMPLQLQLDGIHICHDGDVLAGPSLQARSLLEHCSERDIAVLCFASGAAASEVNRLLDLLLLAENRFALQRNHREATLLAFGIRRIKVTLCSPAAPDNRRIELDEQGRALLHYQELASALQQNHRLAYDDHELAVDQMATAVERTVKDCDEPSMLLSLSMQDDVDRFTIGHSVRVALLALQVARATGASRDQLVRVGAAALMHDIGKSKVPQEILFKQGRLSREEWHWMAQHPRLGAQILIEQHEHVDSRTIGTAFCHHLGPSGAGYPEALLPAPPSATSRLVRVCDVFEALTAVRPYKRALTPIEAFAVMFRNEQDFDPAWLRAFTKTLGLFPTGTRVELNNGAQGIVIAQSNNAVAPEVRLLTGAQGVDLPAGHPDTLVIGQPFEGGVPSISGITYGERFVPVPEFDDDPAAVGPTAHDACLAQHPHDHTH